MFQLGRCLHQNEEKVKLRKYKYKEHIDDTDLGINIKNTLTIPILEIIPQLIFTTLVCKNTRIESLFRRSESETHTTFRTQEVSMRNGQTPTKEGKDQTTHKNSVFP